MNDQNETAQLRFLEETAIRLRQNGFTVEPIEDHHLPVCWEKGRLCRVSGKGSVLYRQESVDSIRAQDALQTVIDTAKMTSEYMAILETAPQLKASGLHGDYRVLADFGDAVLAGHPTERGVQFVTWEWDYDREGVHHGHYFQDDYDAAKRDFTIRGNLVPKGALFEPEQLAEIYRALAFVREQDESLSCRRDRELAELMEQVSGLLPADALRQRDAPEQSGMTMKEVSTQAEHFCSVFLFYEEEKMMKIHGTIHFRLILPYFPGFQQEPLPAPVCSHSPDCKDCPYPRHGFLCWGADGTCLRTRMNKINGSEENTNDDSSGSR